MNPASARRISLIASTSRAFAAQEGARMAGDSSGLRSPFASAAIAIVIPPPGWRPERTAARARKPCN